MKNLAQSFYDWYTQTLHYPKYRWLLVAGSLMYLLSPIDISPDFLPIIGWIDDGVVATLLVAELSQILMSVLSGGDRKSEAPVERMSNPTVIEVKPQ